MKNLNVVIGDEAHAHLMELVRKNNYKSQDNMVEALIEITYEHGWTKEVKPHPVLQLTMPETSAIAILKEHLLQTQQDFNRTVNERRELQTKIEDTERTLRNLQETSRLFEIKMKESIPPSSIYQGWTSGPKSMIATQLKIMMEFGIDVSNILQPSNLISKAFDFPKRR